jgi:hypothetical protein
MSKGLTATAETARRVHPGNSTSRYRVAIGRVFRRAAIPSSFRSLAAGPFGLESADGEGRMDRHHYYVMQDRAGWRIQSDGENSEPFATKRDAVRGAVDLAHLDERNGRPARVVVQGEDHLFRPGWNSGSDPYPPRA